MGLTVGDSHASSGQVRVTVYDAEMLRETFDDWDDLSPTEKYEATRDPISVPEWFHETPNVTCVGLDESIVDALDPSQPSNVSQIDALAVGDDDSTTPSHSDTELNNEIGTVNITSTEDQGGTIFASWFIDTSQLNGETFTEVGVLDGSSNLLNHALISSVDKSSSIAVTVEVKLTFTNK